MSRYTVHARRFAGPLNAPARNDTQTLDTDDHGEATRTGCELALAGWRVWLYENAPPVNRGPEYPYGLAALEDQSRGPRVIREW